jgi:predicted RNase H-like nuclease (RuvC/YqgF family)
MILTGTSGNPTGLGETEQQAKDIKRLLAKAEQRSRKLEKKVADQKQQIRELQAQTKHEDNLVAEREELKAEVAELTRETKELTRANREQVEKIEALRAEIAKLKTGSKIQPSSKRAVGADPHVSPRLVLS